MFGLFTPSCPLDLANKTWVERRMLWFAERFGLDRLRTARVVTPTDEFFPDRYAGDAASARRLLARVCGYMGVDPGAVTLEVLSADQMPGVAGLYEMRDAAHVRVSDAQLADPAQLVATLAHELAHDVLLRGGHLTGREPDHETTTDLLPAYLGLGVFAANATLRETHYHDGGMFWWGLSKHGYLSSVVYGYALALFARARGEDAPDWAHHLRTDARKTLASGLRFLRKTGDALFTPDAAAAPPQLTPALALERLGMRSPTFRLAALWDISDAGLADPRLLAPVVEHLTDPDDALRLAAALAVAVFGPAALGVVPKLLDLLHDDAARAAAAWALGVMRPPANDVVPGLNRLLLDADPRAVAQAAGALSPYGAEAASALPNLLVALEHAVEARDERTAELFATLWAVCPDPREAVRRHFGARDPDLLRMALNQLKHSG